MTVKISEPWGTSTADEIPSTVSTHISSEVELMLCWPQREDWLVLDEDIPYGEPIPFTGRDCCDFGSNNQEGYTTKIWPTRCKKHDKAKALWRRKNTWIKKFEKHFDKAIHKHIKMITLTTHLHGDRSPEEYRAILREEFYKMRQTKTWKKHIHGGIWFFEYTTKEFHQMNWENSDLGNNTTESSVILNPHLHILVLGKYFPQDELSKLSNAYKLGKIVDIRADKDKSLSESLAYLTHYLKKERYQVNGRNRNCFGIMMNKK